ncbi:MAG: hypothetical protein WA071_02060 [Undibacterium umbellatum]|uniref:hypothetical protein n=1 Tax=Undibacterium umbellatum TaxID=2762300 RepID=UPI003BB7724F
MSSHTYKQFIRELCVLCHLVPAGDFYDDTNLVIDGVNFSLFECNASNTGTAVYFCDAGPIEQGEFEHTSRQALVTNLAWFSAFSPSFAIDPDTQRFVLTGRLDISTGPAENLILLGQVAHLSRQWQVNHIVTDLTPKQPGMGPRRHRAAPRSMTGKDMT